MKSIWAPCVLLALGVLAGPTRAAEVPTYRSLPIVVRVDLLQMSDATAQNLAGQSRLPRDLLAGGAGVRVLHSSELLQLSGVSCRFSIGEKYPIVYYEPKATQFQIQYVDVGMKLDVRCEATEGDFLIDANPEMSAIVATHTVGNPPSASYPETVMFRVVNQVPHVRYGESVIVGRIHGPSAHRLMQSSHLPGATPTTSAGDNLMMVVTVSQP